MKTIGLLLALTLFAGCKKGGSAASQCSDAVSKGVDNMIAARKAKMEKADMPPELKAKMDERAKQMDQVSSALKQAITNRCTEDKWSADVITCYSSASSMAEFSTCRGKLPAEQQAKLKNDEMQVMLKMGGAGGMPGAHSMGRPGMGGAPEQNATPPAPPVGGAPAEGSAAGGAMGAAGAGSAAGSAK